MKLKNPNLFVAATFLAVIGAFMMWVAPQLIAEIPYEPKWLFLVGHFLEPIARVFGFIILFIAAALTVKSI